MQARITHFFCSLTTTITLQPLFSIKPKAANLPLAIIAYLCLQALVGRQNGRPLDPPQKAMNPMTRSRDPNVTEKGFSNQGLHYVGLGIWRTGYWGFLLYICGQEPQGTNIAVTGA